MVGDVVVSRFPFTNLTVIEIRPVLVVADVRPEDWIVCQITGRGQNRSGDIAITQRDMETGRLRRDSWVRTHRLHTLNEGLFGQRIGRLTDAKLAEILAAVRSLF